MFTNPPSSAPPGGSGPPPPLFLPSNKRYHVYLSHNWSPNDNHARVARLYEELTALGLRVFLDEVELGSCNTGIERSIFQAMEASAVVVLCITEEYICKTMGLRGSQDKVLLEFIYARRMAQQLWDKYKRRHYAAPGEAGLLLVGTEPAGATKYLNMNSPPPVEPTMVGPDNLLALTPEALETFQDTISAIFSGSTPLLQTELTTEVLADERRVRHSAQQLADSVARLIAYFYDRPPDSAAA